MRKILPTPFASQQADIRFPTRCCGSNESDINRQIGASVNEKASQDATLAQPNSTLNESR